MYASELARRAGVAPDTVRYYGKLGMLQPQQNNSNSYYEYSSHDLQRLRFIRAAKNLGFTLADIRTMFADAERGESPCPRVRTVIENRLQETQRKIAELQALQRQMQTAIDQWADLPNSQPNGDSVCALIERVGADKHE